MYSDTNLIYILTVLEAIEKLKIYVKDFDNALDFWEADAQLYFNASSNLLLAIGEETAKIDTQLKEQFNEIPWNAIKNLRNRLAHDYRGSDPEVIWQIIIIELRPLKEVLIKMLDFIDYDKKVLHMAIESNYYQHLTYLKNIK